MEVAMRKEGRTGSVRIEVTFPAEKAVSCLSGLAKIPGVLFYILRGRVTAREAVYQLELKGRDAGVNEAIWSLRAAASCP
jgi:hypothetical protein